jgi:hypothetical protein
MNRRKTGELWAAYDDAGKLALDLQAKARIIGEPLSEELKWLAAKDAERARAVELLDLLRALLRERIEADAAAGKDVRRA